MVKKCKKLQENAKKCEKVRFFAYVSPPRRRQVTKNINHELTRIGTENRSQETEDRGQNLV